MKRMSKTEEYKIIFLWSGVTQRLLYIGEYIWPRKIIVHGPKPLSDRLACGVNRLDLTNKEIN